jgi:hypothetical protein
MKRSVSQNLRAKLGIGSSVVLMALSVPAVVVRISGRLGHKLDIVDWALIGADLAMFGYNARLLSQGQLKRSFRFSLIYAAVLIVTGVKIDMPIYLPIAMNDYVVQQIVTAPDLQSKQVAEWAYIDYHDEKLAQIALTSRTIVRDNNCAYVTRSYYSFLTNPLLADVRKSYIDDLKACGTFRKS